MPNQQDGENNVGVPDVRSKGKRPQIPVPIWVGQLAHKKGWTIRQVQEKLVAEGFPAKSIGLY